MNLKDIEATWELIARVLAFFFGAYLVYNEQKPPPGVEWMTMLAGIGCMGPVIAGTVASLLIAFRGGSGPPAV